jgi:pimeloyl-ACP methyl ester carboxylesterase
MTQYDEIDEEVDRDMGWDQLRGQPAGTTKKRPKKSPLLALLHQLWQACAPLRRSIATITRGFRRIAFFPIVSPLSYSRYFDGNGNHITKRALPWRILDGVLTRLILSPLIVAAFLLYIVYANTHPARVQASSTPESLGVYFKRVDLLTIDNQRLAAWYIPPLTTDEVAFDPEGALTEKWPAVVVCHGLGATQNQYLPLANKLHAAGFAVLMMDTRGQGESGASAVTYGLRERMDVLAGVKYLRERDSIDASKVCVVGHDIAATAVLQAAALDSSITAVVADGIWPSFDDRARQIFGRPFGADSFSTRWLAPLYTIAFEVVIRDGLNQLEPRSVLKSLHTQPVLFVARTGEAYEPVQDVLALATSVGSKHRVILADETVKAGHDVDQEVCSFLMTSTGWHGPNARGVNQIQRLLRNRVK